MTEPAASCFEPLELAILRPSPIDFSRRMAGFGPVLYSLSLTDMILLDGDVVGSEVDGVEQKQEVVRL